MSHKDRSIERRKVMQVLGGASAVALTGCLGDDDDEPDNLGEEVPTVVIEYWSPSSRASVVEDSLPTVESNLQDRLGLDVQIEPVEVATQITNTHDDRRTHDIGFWFHNPDSDRLDPQEMTRRYAGDWAGSNDLPNPINYANCDHTRAAIQQEFATTEDERRELVTEAHSIMSEDLGTIPITRIIDFAVARADKVSLNRAGEMGISQLNPYVYIASDMADGEDLVSNVTSATVETTNFAALDAVFSLAVWNHLVHTPLVAYDENFELTNILAEDYTVEDGGEVVTIEIKDAEFHNGDAITAEDVQFTFEQLSEHPGVYPKADIPDFSSIDIINDRTVQFNFEQPSTPFLTATLPGWGIFHKESWIEAGAQEDPEGVQFDPVVGSGPFQVEDIDPGQSLLLTPHDGHPDFSPDHRVIFEQYADESAEIEAFLQGNLTFMHNISPGANERINDEMESENLATTQYDGFIPYMLYPQCSSAPSKFKEFREAIGMVINRAEINEIALYGESEPITVSCPILDNHPFYPGDENLNNMTDDLQGDEEGAREVLREAGWGWDEDGNLHYPTDADLDPLWPEGEMPDVEYGFECIENGEFVG